MTQHLRRILSTIVLSVLAIALGQEFDLTRHLEFYGAPKRVVQRKASQITNVTEFSANGLRATLNSLGPSSVDSVWEFDPSNAQLEVTFTADTFNSISTYTFDDSGRTLSNLDLMDSGGKISVTLYEYRYASDFRTVDIYRYSEWEPAGELIERITFDEAGRKVFREFLMSDGTVGSQLTYNERGFAIESFSPLTQQRAKHEYEYDHFGNWTKRTSYEWVERLDRYENEGSVTTREITYY